MRTSFTHWQKLYPYYHCHVIRLPLFMLPDMKMSCQLGFAMRKPSPGAAECKQTTYMLALKKPSFNMGHHD